MLNFAAMLTVCMPLGCRQLFSAVIIATASTSGAASRRGCPQRARSMFRTVSEIRAGNGRSFIAENASAPVPEAFARSERRGEAVGGSRKHFPIFWAIMPTCSRSIGRVCIWYPFSSSGLGANATSRRAHLTPPALQAAAPPRHSRRQASRRPSPPRAPLPRRRVRRGCAEPAPPAGPGGAPGAGQPLRTLRSPPRPRGGANRAGERAPPLLSGEPRRGWFQRT